MGRVESENFPIHTMKVYGGGGDIAIFILNLGTRPRKKKVMKFVWRKRRMKKIFKILFLGRRRVYLILSFMYQMTY
jgi:hypothetical protein